MDKVEGSITDWTDEHMLFTYSEDEKQENEMNKANAKLVFSPEFIPYYIAEQRKYNLTMVETLVYWFIRFYMKNSQWRFYFTNEQLGSIIGIAEGTVNNVIKRLSDLNLIEKSQKMRVGWGTIRFITRVNCWIPIEYTPQCTPNTLHSAANKNKIKENKTKQGWILDFLLKEENKERISYTVISMLDRLWYTPPDWETEDSFVERLKSALEQQKNWFMATIDKRLIEFETYWKEDKSKKKPNRKSRLLNNFNQFNYDN